MKSKSYHIKEGYQCNPVSIYKGSLYNSNRWQIPVYRFAAKRIRKDGLISVLDIGCGFGAKLFTYIYPVCKDITGIDLDNQSIDFCKETYNFGEWFVDNIESPGLSLDRKFDLIIISDVIEHLLDPDKLFEYIKRYASSKTICILSTPERDIVRGKDNFGPPDNPCHVREWNAKEFSAYCKLFLVKDRVKYWKICQIFQGRLNG